MSWTRRLATQKRRLEGEGGFGLVEALVASLILIVGIGATVTVFVSSGHAGATAERHQSAVALAQEEIERIRSMPYDEIGLATLSYPAGELGADLPNPGSRVAAGFYTPAHAAEAGQRLPAERLVVSDAGRSYGLAPYETVSLESRSGTETAHIFRFVTWRDEECPLLTLSDFDLSLADLGATVSALVQNLTLQLGNSGLVGTAQGARGTLAGLQPVTGSLASNVDELLAALDHAVGPVNRLANEVLAPVAGQLVASLSALTGLDLSLDICDIDLSSVQRLRTIESALGALEQPLGTITTAQAQEARSAIASATQKAADATAEDRRCEGLIWPLNVTCRAIGSFLRGLINSLTGLVDGVTGLLLGTDMAPGMADLADQMPPDLNTALADGTAGAITDIASLPGFIDQTVAGLGQAGTDENTKRVVVAVVLQHGGPAGPRQPIWMSTVVTDPAAGLLQP